MCLWNQVGDHRGHSMDGWRKKSNCMSWLRLLGRAVIQIWDGQQKNNNVIQITALANNDTTTWLHEFVKVYLIIFFSKAGKWNLYWLNRVRVVLFKNQDSNKDIETNTCSTPIPDNNGLSQTTNLPERLKLCVGPKVMATDNISVFDILINGSIATVKQLDRRSKPHCSTIYVKAGNSLKDRRLCGDLKECVPDTAKRKRFPLNKVKSKKKKTISVNTWWCNYCP